MTRIIYLLVIICLIGTSCSGPKAIFQINKEGSTAPLKVTTVNNSTGADSYSWDFGDGYISQDSLASHRYLRSGRYKVKLKASKDGKSSVTEKEVFVEPPQECLVHIETNMGNMIARIYDETPKHRDNFLKLAGESYYDGMIFHRVIDGFMIQGGDPKSKNPTPDGSYGNGGPGYTLDAEIRQDLVHVKGALAAARLGDAANPEKKSSGSQFYIVHGKAVTNKDLTRTESKNGMTYSPELKERYLEVGGTPFLDQNYTVFGVVIEGLDVVDKIANLKTNNRDRPLEDVIMKVSVIK